MTALFGRCQRQQGHSTEARYKNARCIGDGLSQDRRSTLEVVEEDVVEEPCARGLRDRVWLRGRLPSEGIDSDGIGEAGKGDDKVVDEVAGSAIILKADVCRARE